MVQWKRAVFERYGKDPIGDTPMFHFHRDYGRKDIFGGSTIYDFRKTSNSLLSLLPGMGHSWLVSWNIGLFSGGHPNRPSWTLQKLARTGTSTHSCCKGWNLNLLLANLEGNTWVDGEFDEESTITVFTAFSLRWFSRRISEPSTVAL